jgi:formate C-acetyltransferase
MREVCGSVEGIGESILGHLDRMTWPLLQADLAAGRATMEDARDSIDAFLAMTDAKANIRREPRETSTTVVVGGCDRHGEWVYNPVTDLILDAYRDLNLVNPKLNARISSRHPREYFRRLADLASRTNVLAIFNDEVIIAANVRAGKAIEDARLYVGGGCQENVLQNTEISSRASIYLNLAHVLRMGFFPEQWAEYLSSSGVEIEPYAGAETFEEFRRRFLANLRAVHDEHVDRRNLTEREGGWYNPCPLHSATLDDCIERAKDMFAGGTRYAGASVSLIGAGTLIDSLRAVEQAVYERGEMTLDELAGLLETDFARAEERRSYLANRIDKFGSDDPATARFAADVLADLARVTTGKPNTRGGRYEASLFVYRAFLRMGAKTGATPDGRPAGEPLSPGMSPSPLGVGNGAGVASVLGALEPVDLTDFPVVAVLDLKLPWAGAGLNGEVVESVIRRFLDAGGSVLQLNVIDPAELADAREHPERHADLVVRVSGYSARFTTLPEHIQDEIIGRATVAV